ncbi:MAG TPA: hypothetical protein VGC95_00395 [Chitinophagaceae bacterium]|jgi:hypothetical protein
MKAVMLAIVLGLIMTLSSRDATAQCSICTRTTQQMGDQPAKGINAGILYLAFAPFAIVAAVGYRWWRNNRQ